MQFPLQVKTTEQFWNLGIDFNQDIKASIAFLVSNIIVVVMTANARF